MITAKEARELTTSFEFKKLRNEMVPQKLKQIEKDIMAMKDSGQFKIEYDWEFFGSYVVWYDVKYELKKLGYRVESSVFGRGNMKIYWSVPNNISDTIGISLIPV
jgi:hypothetical protein